MDKMDKMDRMEWGELMPFDEPEIPDFPLDCLPAVVEGYVEKLAEATQTPPEMAGVLSLGVLATLYQSKYEVEVTSSWREPLSLYTVAIAPPGERKSAVISGLTKPLYQYEAQRQKAEAGELARERTAQEMLERELEKAKKKGDTAQAMDLAEKLANRQERAPYRLLVDDTTPERLATLMVQQGGSITVASAEGGVFGALKGRYSGGSSLEIYLKGHAGDPITVDRITRTADQIERPHLSMILTVQPIVIQGLLSDPEATGRGLCGRMLYAMCRSKVGHRIARPEPVRQETQQAYEAYITAALDTPWRGILKLSPAADVVHVAYQNEIEWRLTRDWAHMQAWGCKLPGTALRIAGLLHAAQAIGDPTNELIGPETMEAAVHISRCLGQHTEAAYASMAGDPVEEQARYLYRRLLETGKEAMSKRELWQMVKGPIGKVEAMEAPLKQLEARNYIKQQQRRTGGKGRPSVMIYVNPAGTSGSTSIKTPQSPR